MCIVGTIELVCIPTSWCWLSLGSCCCFISCLWCICDMAQQVLIVRGSVVQVVGKGRACKGLADVLNIHQQIPSSWSSWSAVRVTSWMLCNINHSHYIQHDWHGIRAWSQSFSHIIWHATYGLWFQYSCACDCDGVFARVACWQWYSMLQLYIKWMWSWTLIWKATWY
jgi:hypothetical protein